jgi:outer membrane protein assembly factor BamB
MRRIEISALPRWIWAGGLLLGLFLAVSPAHALITRLTPLRDVVDESNFIFTVTVDSVDAGKPALLLVADEQLKGTAPFRQLPVLLKGDAEAKKGNHVALLLKRVAPKLPLVVFVLKREKSYVAFAYTNGTWFQMTGQEVDGLVRWSFTHGEPYLRKTFKGSTADLRQIIADSLAGKRKPPEPDMKEKPGFGPEVEAENKDPKTGAHVPGRDGPLFAVIPTVLVGGPLALLAMLFPAIFGGLTLVLRRWMVALSVLSLNSTLYLVQNGCLAWLAGSWWGTPSALWLTMLAVTLLGILWAWRRQVVSLAAEEKKAAGAAPPSPGWVELLTLALLSLACLVMVVLYVPSGLAHLEMWARTLVVFSIGLWMATLHDLSLRWRGARRPVQPGLPGEGVLLGSMLLAGLAFSGSLASDSSGPGVAHDNGPYRVAWRFRPPVERCWLASSPAVDGDHVYVGVVFPSAFKSSGAVYCVDRFTGKDVWMFNDGGQMKDVFSSPRVADGRLYIGEGFHQHADCKLYCLDAGTGRKLWEFTTASHTEATPCVARGKVYCGAGDDGLYCLDAATGQEQWHLKGLHVDADPLVVGRRVYGGSGVGDAYRDTVLFCLDADTGAEVWRLPTDLPVWGMPSVMGGHLYAGVGNGNFLASADQLDRPEKPAGAVLCLDAATGERLWRHDVGDGVLARVSVDARHVYFASRDRHCYCVDRRDGTLCWKADVGSPVVASPFLLEGGSGTSLYVAGSAGSVSRLDPETGKSDWTFDVGADAQQTPVIFSSPAVMAREGPQRGSRLIYFGCGLNDFSRGVLYCLEEGPKAAS